MTNTAWVSKTDEKILQAISTVHCHGQGRRYFNGRTYVCAPTTIPGQENWTAQEKDQRENHHIQENQDRRFRLEQHI